FAIALFNLLNGMLTMMVDSIFALRVMWYKMAKCRRLAQSLRTTTDSREERGLFALLRAEYSLLCREIQLCISTSRTTVLLLDCAIKVSCLPFVIFLSKQLQPLSLSAYSMMLLPILTLIFSHYLFWMASYFPTENLRIYQTMTEWSSRACFQIFNRSPK